ncbi:MAG: hypothetical protein LBS84_09030 [Clostridiales bacterium]|jgi:hypothetical protein|nr:hypothetical protein [Clostridiales bacterium]
MNINNFGYSAWGMLYGNVRIRKIRNTANGDGLRIKVLYAEREYQDIYYDDVFFSQIDESCLGLDILYAEEVTVTEMLAKRYDCVTRFIMSNGKGDAVLSELKDTGFRFFINYLSRRQEYLVVAKSVFVGREHISFR